MLVIGADRLGRDMFSRVIYGARISLSIGLIGVLASLYPGVVIGGISGYFGGAIDTFIQRMIEFVRSIPTKFHCGWASARPCRPPGRLNSRYFGITSSSRW